MRSKCFIQILALLLLLLLLLLVIVFSFRRLVNKVIIFYRSLLRISCTDSWGEKEERKRCRTPMDQWRNQPPSPRKLSAGGICIGIFSLSAGFLLPPPSSSQQFIDLLRGAKFSSSSKFVLSYFTSPSLEQVDFIFFQVSLIKFCIVAVPQRWGGGREEGGQL